jgi:hypothetical protein
VQALHDRFLSGWSFGALARGFAFGSRRTGCAAAAIFGKEAKQRVHLLELRRIDHRAALAADSDKTRRAKSIKVERQGIGREIESVCDRSRWQAPRSSLHKQPKYVEAIVLRERRQGGNSICRFHISMFVEIIFVVKCYFSIH